MERGGGDVGCKCWWQVPCSSLPIHTDLIAHAHGRGGGYLSLSLICLSQSVSIHLPSIYLTHYLIIFHFLRY